MCIKKHLLIFSLMFSCCWGFSQYYYIPDNSTNLLLLKQKKEVKASTAFPSKSLKAFQLGYSPIKRLGLSLSYFKHKVKINGINAGTSGNTFSASIGLYSFFEIKATKFLDEEANSGILLDTYIGYTKGKIKNNYVSITSASLEYDKVFIHTGLHYISRFVSLSYSMRISILDYKSGIITGAPTSTETNIIETEILVNEPYTLLESDLRLHLGTELVRAYVQLSFLNPNILEREIINERNLIFSAGIVLNFRAGYRLAKKINS